MRRKHSLSFVLAFITILSGCSYSGYDNLDTALHTPQTQLQNNVTLKDNIQDLVNEINVNLKIQKQNGTYYKATQYFTVRVIEMLKRFNPVNQTEIDQKAFDFKLSFEGYEDMYMNSQTGLLWFEGENQVYGLNSWSGEYWMRCVLEEIDGEIMYSSFERDIIGQSSDMDIDRNGESDDVLLYYDGDIRLRVNEADVTVLLGASRDAISSIEPSNQYICNLYIKDDPDNNKYQFLVGIAYSFTNKYGSTSLLSCYEYKNGSLEKTWSSDSELRREIKAVDYKNGNLSISIDGQEDIKKIILNDEQKESMQKYKENLEDKNEKFNWKDICFESHITPQYKFFDYDNNGKDELITYSVVQGGPCLCLGDLYFSIYSFSSDGISLEDSFFGSCNKTFKEKFFN